MFPRGRLERTLGAVRKFTDVTCGARHLDFSGHFLQTSTSMQKAVDHEALAMVKNG